MPKSALYGAAIVFTAQAIILAALYFFDADIFVGRTLFRPLNIFAAGTFFLVLGGWMFIASLEIRSDEKANSKKRRT